MAQPPVISLPKVSPSTRDIGFALGIVAILCVLFLPIPARQNASLPCSTNVQLRSTTSSPTWNVALPKRSKRGPQPLPGIGASLVEAFAMQGAKVAFIDIAEEPSEALVRRLSGAASAHLRDLIDVCSA